MASSEVEIIPAAEAQLRALPDDDRPRIARALLALADQPHPRGSRKLSGYDDVFRARVGRHRVLYSVVERRLIILVLKIGNRKEAR